MKRLLSSLLTTIVVLSAFVPVSARSIDPKGDSAAVARVRAKMDEIRKHRPTVALVLSGGGAKGAAHVGAIKYIEELGIPVDMVLGTSIGGLVGGLYSLGYPIETVDSLMKNMDWNWVLSDELSRDYISYTDSKYKEKYMISIPFYYEKDYYNMKLAEDYRFDEFNRHEHLDIGADNARGGEILRRNLLGSLPSGFVYGQNVSNLISSLTIGYQDSIAFSELPIPFACVASDMVSGKTKIWHSGKINNAMRSTMSIPGLFAPVRIDGMVLVDGGLRDNYPTALARRMGADIIIGVDLSQKPKSYMEVNNLADILSQGIDMMMRDSYEENVKIPDVKIKPYIPEFNMMSFNTDAIDTIMVRGYMAAASQDTLLRIIAQKTAGKYTPVRKPQAFDFHTDSLVIADVDIKGVLPKEKALLKDKLHLKFGQKISRKDLDHIVAQIYGTQAYDYVTYELLGESEPFKLVFTCRKGPVHQFGLGVRADTEEIVSVLLNIGLNTHRLYGHSLDLTGKISANPYMQMKWSFDGPKFPTVNVAGSLRWTDLNTLNLWEHKLGFRFMHAKQEAYFSNMTWRKVDFNAGLRNEYFRIRNIKSEDILGDYDFDQLNNDFVSLFIAGRTDTFDDGYFPTKGVKAHLSYAWTFAGYPKDFNNFHTLSAGVKGVVPIGDIFAYIPYANLRFLLGHDVPVAYFNAIGGSLAGRYVDQQLPFIGVTNLWAMKNLLTMAGMDFRFKLYKNHYLTGVVNYVRDCDSFDTYVNGMGYFGAGIEYAYDTIFGPIKANIHWSNMTGKVGFYICAGYNF
jgi:NTE family protein